jgi:outer membrane biosynthesis protein TonB
MDEEPATRIDGDAQGRAQSLTQAHGSEQELEQDPEVQPRTTSRGDAPLGELFSDLDLPADQEPQPEGEDALAALGEAPARPQVENTSYYVNKAGVNRRNPPWKIGLFLLLLVGIPVAALYLLSELQVVPPLKVTRVNAQGRTVEENVSYFSSEGMGELRDRMLGQQQPPPAPPPPAPAPQPKQEPTPAPPAPAAEQKPPEQGLAPPEGEANKELQQLYADSAKQDVGPEARKDAEVADKDTAAQAGPSQEVIDRVVRKAQGAFEGCIAQALRKGARFREGKAVLTATLAPSGTVTKAEFDRKDVENSEMGRCIKARARKLAFPRFSGNEVDVEIPLILTKAL